jgi:glutaredoxin
LQEIREHFASRPVIEPEETRVQLREHLEHPAGPFQRGSSRHFAVDEEPRAGEFKKVLPQVDRSPVLLSSTSWSGACKRAKHYLDSNRVNYRELDIDSDAGAREEVERVVGRVAIPLLNARSQHISGFCERVYARALGLTP